MSQEGMQALFGAAIIDSAFCKRLLACPAEAAEGFDLTGEEVEVLSRIRANSLQQFAAKFERWRTARAMGRERPLYCFPKVTCLHQRLAG